MYYPAEGGGWVIKAEWWRFVLALQADIGLSMGIAGTEVAKESSDIIIILDEDFTSAAKVCGRVLDILIMILYIISLDVTCALSITTLVCISGCALGTFGLLQHSEVHPISTDRQRHCPYH